MKFNSCDCLDEAQVSRNSTVPVRVSCPAPGGGSKGDDSVLYPDPGLLIVSLQTGPAVPLTGPSPVVPLRADIGGPDDVSIALPTLTV